MFKGLLTAGQAVLEGGERPTIRVTHTARRATMEQLTAEARRNPRLHVAIGREGHRVKVEPIAAVAPVKAPSPAAPAARSERKGPTVGPCGACGRDGVLLGPTGPVPHRTMAGQKCDGKAIAAAPAAPAAIVTVSQAPAVPAPEVVSGEVLTAAPETKVGRLTPLAPMTDDERWQMIAGCWANGYRIVELMQFLREITILAPETAPAAPAPAPTVAAAPVAAAAPSHDCYRCGKPAQMGYVLGGKVCCRGCRGEHRAEYYASRGQEVRPRRDRSQRAERTVSELHVRAERVTVVTAPAEAV